jgi:hypothetical protein
MGDIGDVGGGTEAEVATQDTAVLVRSRPLTSRLSKSPMSPTYPSGTSLPLSEGNVHESSYCTSPHLSGTVKCL